MHTCGSERSPYRDTRTRLASAATHSAFKELRQPASAPIELQTLQLFPGSEDQLWRSKLYNVLNAPVCSLRQHCISYHVAHERLSSRLSRLVQQLRTRVSFPQAQQCTIFAHAFSALACLRLSVQNGAYWVFGVRSLCRLWRQQ